MEKDDPRQSGGGRRPSGGGGNLLKWLPFILFFVFKRPKLLIPILAVGLVWYFFLGGSEVLSGSFEPSDEIDPSQYALGATLSEERFDQAQVFEPLAYGYGSLNQLPARVSLQQFAPRRLHQGRQGSCVGWASAYAARTILQAQTTGNAPDQVAFSPAYLYNQIHLDNCQGAYMLDAMKAMAQNGALPFREFAYNEQTCQNYPDRTDINRGQAFRIKGYNRLTLGASNYKPDVTAIKQNLAQGAPVVIGMMVGGTFMSRMLGQRLWTPNSADYTMRGFGGHAMCVIGYDDDYADGAFQIMNSWGEDWGDRGIFWMRYRDFEHFTREAYGVYPMGTAGDEKFDDSKFGVEFGLLDINTKEIIPLQQAGDIVFRTRQPLSAADKFKVLFANSIECYVYIFGEETDGSSYVLFPYTPKHSPYCGITGTRLFPRDYSMSPDELGQRDRIAVVVSKKELDFQQLNGRINAARGRSYTEKLKAALAEQRIRTVKFGSGNTISFEAESTDQNLVGMVIEIDKQ